MKYDSYCCRDFGRFFRGYVVMVDGNNLILVRLKLGICLGRRRVCFLVIFFINLIIFLVVFGEEVDVGNRLLFLCIRIERSFFL